MNLSFRTTPGCWVRLYAPFSVTIPTAGGVVVEVKEGVVVGVPSSEWAGHVDQGLL